MYQYSSMGPKFSGQNCKFLKFLLSFNSQKRLGYKENNTKYRSLTWKPQNHVRILIYRTWPIGTRTKIRAKQGVVLGLIFVLVPIYARPECGKALCTRTLATQVKPRDYEVQIIVSWLSMFRHRLRTKSQTQSNRKQDFLVPVLHFVHKMMSTISGFSIQLFQKRLFLWSMMRDAWSMFHTTRRTND